MRGSITVFLSLLLSTLLLASMMLLETARYSCFRTVARMAAETAADSVAASFHQELMNEYGLLFLDASGKTGYYRTENLEKSFEDYVKKNMNSDLLHLRGTFFRASDVTAELSGEIRATDYNGEIFILSALSFYKYDAPAELLAGLQDSVSAMGRGEEKRSLLNRLSEPFYALPGGGMISPMFCRETPAVPAAAVSPIERKTGRNLIISRDEAEATGVLSLVLPGDRRVSTGNIDLFDAPSQRKAGESSCFPVNLINKVVFNEYLLSVFPDFTAQSGKEGMRYEAEYLLCHEPTDEANLRGTVTRLLFLREGMNVLYIESDSELREAADALGTALLGWTGNPVLIKAAQCLVKLAWAYAEALVDVKTLLSGKKVPLQKDEESWTLDLGLAEELLDGRLEITGKGDRGLNYREYLRLFLFLTDANDLAYRAMDLIQANIRRADGSFYMENCLFSFQFDTVIRGKEMFSALPVARKWYFLKRRYNFYGCFSASYL